MIEYILGIMDGGALVAVIIMGSIETNYIEPCEKENNVHKCELTAVPVTQKETNNVTK